MSDTFQRVYDNAKANAVMEQAAMILSLESELTVNKRKACSDFIQKRCCPEELYYGDDAVTVNEGELKKVTFQVKEQLDDVHEILNEVQSGQAPKTRFKSDLDALRHTVSALHNHQLNIVHKVEQEVSEIKVQLTQLVSGQTTKLRRKRSPAISSTECLPAINETKATNTAQFQEEIA